MVGTQDPYIKLWTSSSRSSKKKTKTYEDGGPIGVWNEKFDFDVENQSSEFLFLEIWNENTFKVLYFNTNTQNEPDFDHYYY